MTGNHNEVSSNVGTSSVGEGSYFSSKGVWACPRGDMYIATDGLPVEIKESTVGPRPR